MSASPWWVAPEIPPFSFQIRKEPEHFRVTEVRQGAPSGQGEHLHVWIEKRNLTTSRAVRIVCQALGVPVRRAGVAGRKDKRAVTRQWISIQGGRGENLSRIHSTQVKVLDWAYDDRKLRRGAHGGNRFDLFLSGFDPHRREEAQEVLEQVMLRGLPNFFGEQRYGKSGSNARLGKALWLGQERVALAAYGESHFAPQESVAASQRARWFDWLEGSDPHERPICGTAEPDPAGGQSEIWPSALARLVRSPCPDDWRGLVQRIPREERRFAMQAAQSGLFDEWVVVRAEAGALFGPPVPGDCLGQVGLRDQPWATGEEPGFPEGDAPLGPLFGASMNQSQGRAREFEQAALRVAGWPQDGFPKGSPQDDLPQHDLPQHDLPRGSRRPLLVPVRDGRIDWEGDGAWLRFQLPPGAYATTLLAQWSKDFQGPRW